MINIKRIFVDIETSLCEGRFWRVGRNIDLSPENITKPAGIICICYKWQHEKKIHALTWDENHNDKRMLDEFIEVLNEADEIVAHNGKSFDLKWIMWKCLMHKIPAFPSYKMVDTLSLMRSKFRAPSNRLEYLAQVLFEKEKQDTGGLRLWHDVMDGDQTALKKMVNYCKQDVVLLEELFLTIESYFPPQSNVAVLNNRDRWACPYCGSEKVNPHKVRSTTSGIIRHQFRCSDCLRYYTISNSLFDTWVTNKIKES